MVQMCVARLVDGKILVGPQLIADLNGDLLRLSYLVAINNDR